VPALVPDVLAAGSLRRRSQPVLTDGDLAWAFEVGCHRLERQHSTCDPALCRVAESSGFALEGTRVRSLLHDDGWHDMHLHGSVSDR
jgi:hypothetical protein